MNTVSRERLASGWSTSLTLTLLALAASAVILSYELLGRLFETELPSWLSDLTITALTGILVYISNLAIVHRERVQCKTREDQQHFVDAVIRNLPAMACVVDSKGNFRFWNANIERTLGYSTSELARISVEDTIAEQSREDVRQITSVVFATGAGETEATLLTKHGKEIPCFLTGVRIVVDGQPCLLGISVDISERQKADQKLRLLSAASEAAANAIVITNREGNIVWVNKAFSSTSGFARDEVLGSNPRILHSGQHDKTFYADLWSAIVAGRVWSGEITNRRKDGTLYTEEMTITPVRISGEDISHFVAIKQDITERKLLERQLRQSQKMEAIGRLAGGVAHDFNNMLGIITGYCDLLQMGELTPHVGKQVRAIDEAAKKAATLTQQLLAFSRKQIVQPRILDLNDILRKLHHMLRRILGEDIELVMRCAASVDLRVKADENQIEQILMNLVINARDAMPQGGSLIIETDSCQLDETYVFHHRPMRPGLYVRLTVTDTGCGMDQTTLSQLFEPFFTTKEAGRGTGLGLSIVYGIVKQSDGYIWAYSEPARGTSFKIYLPRKDAPLSRVIPQPVVESLRGSETILLVEDDEGLRKMVHEFLTRQGYSVLEADSGANAISLLEHQRHPHILITDLMMPGMGGRELARHIAAKVPGVKVLFMSGYTHESGLKTRTLEEREEFLQKPFALNELGKKLRKMMS